MRFRARHAASALLAFAAVTHVPAAAADPPPGADATDAYPPAQGRFTTPGDFYWVYFTTPDGRSCGIGPNGGPVGCDAVAADAPDGVNQTVVNSWGPAGYLHSDVATFTRDVDTLPEGHRLTNWGASCAMGPGTAVTCKTYGMHGFVLAADHSVFW
jgi:hypothetical protein